jgi:hypothetical protein
MDREKAVEFVVKKDQLWASGKDTFGLINIKYENHSPCYW